MRSRNWFIESWFIGPMAFVVLALAGQPALAGDLDEHDMEKGEDVYDRACASCHAGGIAGAPETGDAEFWAERMEEVGLETMIERSIEGFTGDAGHMPARGGQQDLSDEEVAAAVAWMVRESR